MDRRTCASCRFYEMSTLARKGWCRNPALVEPTNQHLVSANDLDCAHGAGDFWSSCRQPGAAEDQAVIRYSSAGNPIYAVTGSSGYGDDPPRPPTSGDGGPSWGNGDQDFNYFEEERSWTDWVRIGAPILAVLLLVVLLWFWIANFLGDDGDDDDDVAAGTASIELPTFSASPEATETGQAGGTPPAVAASPTPNTGVPGVPSATLPGTDPTQDPGGGPTEIYLGATVEVANTDGAGVNVRADATTSAEILTVFLDGTQISIIDGPRDVEGFRWWQISGNEIGAGWIVEDFLIVIE